MSRFSDPNESTHRWAGFTVLEFLVVMAVIAILLIMLVPGMGRRRSSGAARRTVCMNNLRQLVLASLNYESVHMHFPAAAGGVTDNTTFPNRISGVVALLPFMDQQAVHDEITRGGSVGPAFAGGQINPQYQPWQTQLDVLGCPEDTNHQSPAVLKPTSYGFCIGDQAREIHTGTTRRGAFGYARSGISFSEIADGTSNTIAYSEIYGPGTLPTHYAINQSTQILDRPALVLRPNSNATTSVAFRGYSWADGAAGGGLFQTILPPGSPSASVGGDFLSDGIYSAGGKHPGGVVVAFLDGSTRFIADDIDCGTLSAAAVTPEQMAQSGIPSPYGVWGALGTINGGEVVEDETY